MNLYRLHFNKTKKTIMKKQLLYLFLITVFTVNCGFAKTATEYATIKGRLNISAKWGKEVKLLKVVDGKAVVCATSVIDANRDFAFLTPITTPGFYYLDYGQLEARFLHLRLYLEPELDFSIVVNEKDYVLEGKNLGHNLLVQQANLIYDSFAKYAKLGTMETYKTFFPFVDNEGVPNAKKFIQSINTNDAEFNKLLALAVQTDIEDLTYLFFRLPNRINPTKSERPAIIKEWTLDKKFTDSNLLKLQNGVNLMANYSFYQIINGTKPPMKMDFIPEGLSHITVPALQEIFIVNELERSKYNVEEYNKLTPILYPILSSEKSKTFLLEFEKKFHKSVGQKGFEFTYKDINDKPVSFSDFKGKYVYIDIWATWCGPCKAEIPYLKKLEEAYRGKDIVFMSVSVDNPKDQQKWKDFVKKEQLSGIQLMADKAFESTITKNYEVKGIPRFLLFDKQGNIISADALRPSNELLKEQLNKLLK